MSSSAKIRVRLPSAEVEIEAPLQEMKQLIALLPEILAQFSDKAQQGIVQTAQKADIIIEHPRAAQGVQGSMPSINLEKSDSLSDIIAKVFQEGWGRKPRKLNQVREALESYGMIYPKQSVAVTLLRLAQSGKLRRFKDETGEFVYTASTALSAQAVQTGQQSNLEIPLGA